MLKRATPFVIGRQHLVSDKMVKIYMRVYYNRVYLFDFLLFVSTCFQIH